MEGREAATAANIDSEIRVERDGPYVVTNVKHFTDWLGQKLPLQPQTALCRCGQSRTKPFCDGSHTTSKFTGEKDPNRIADKRDVYEGQQIEIFDNRGIFAHSGFCTDRLSSVFHVGVEPFITPSGGRMDEIIQAVRSCPSGALSYGIDHVEARIQVDQDREPWIEVSKRRPLPSYGWGAGCGRIGQRGTSCPALFARAFQSVPMWTFAEQTVLKRDALVREIL